MGRILWVVVLGLVVLPLCLVLHGQDTVREAQPFDSAEDLLLVHRNPPVILEGPELARQQILGTLAMGTQASFPASLPWGPLYQIGQNDLYPLENILAYQPALFLEMCLDRYDREVQSYSFTFRKQERIHGKLQEAEKIKIFFRERPFSVFFDWQEGARMAKRVLYVEGENDGKMRVRPNLRLLSNFVLSKDPDGAEAKQSGRYTIKQFGLKLATERTLTAMRKAEARGALHVKYLGEFQVPELHNRPCYKFVRSPYDPPEEEGLNELIFYIDKENWLQVGSILRDTRGDIIAEYYFRELRVNPDIPSDQFTKEKL